MATSTIPVAKAELLAVLKERSELFGVQLTRGHPGDTAERELVWIGKAEWEQVPAALGARRRHEEYTIHLHIEVVRPAEQQEVSERAYELLEAVENALRDKANLNEKVQVAQVSGGDEDEFFAEENGKIVGRGCAIDVRVACQARI